MRKHRVAGCSAIVPNPDRRQVVIEGSVLSFTHALPTIIYLLVMQGEADALNRSLPKSDELSQDECSAVGGAKRRTANRDPTRLPQGTMSMRCWLCRHMKHKHSQSYLPVSIAIAVKDVAEAGFMRPVDAALEVTVSLRR